ncbi:MAG: DUF2062 domain-containing protein [Thermoanaerobaculia bacterium]
MKLPTRAFRRRRHHPLRWRRRFRVLVLDLLGREESPERVAAAIALGIGIGFSPLIGLHIWIALGLALLFRLNTIDAALGSLVGNFWTWPPVFHFGYRLGRLLLGSPHRSMPRLNWTPLLQQDMTWVLHPIRTAHEVFGPHAFLPRLCAFLLGTTILAVLIGLGTYFVARSVLALYHHRHPRIAARAARSRRHKHRLGPPHAAGDSAAEPLQTPEERA